jgi:hypothetical protein
MCEFKSHSKCISSKIPTNSSLISLFEISQFILKSLQFKGRAHKMEERYPGYDQEVRDFSREFQKLVWGAAASSHLEDIEMLASINSEI